MARDEEADRLLEVKAAELSRELRKRFGTALKIKDRPSTPAPGYNDGPYTIVGHWGDQKSLEIVVCLDGFLKQAKKTFWIGFSAQADVAKEFLRRIQADYAVAEREYGRNSITEVDGHWLLREPAPEEMLGTLVFEDYDDDDWMSLGVYQSQDGYDLERVLEFIDLIVGLLDPVATDILEIISTTKKTERMQQILARLGQGQYRQDLEEVWKGVCAVTGVNTRQALRASHIMPWREANPEQRLDRYNGLLLSANIDALFDKYLITFDNDGKIVIADWIGKNREEMERLGLRADMKIKGLKTKHHEYLKSHRRKFDTLNQMKRI
jgi:hypothetical protein